MPIADENGYVKRDGNQIYVRGSVNEPFRNPLTPREARRIAEIIKTKADAVDPVDFEPGQAYMDADGDVFIRNSRNDGWIDVSGDRFTHSYATAPIVKLVPETEVK